VANSLDSGARAIHVEADPTRATLTVVDDGSGMARRELARYHDIAASTKTKGEGIGFAGVGIKLGVLASEEVLTETRRGASHVPPRGVWLPGTRRPGDGSLPPAWSEPRARPCG
jgi:Histidine kinase-, DNA gyrase B-, and HSP90-like ATPase